MKNGTPLARAIRLAIGGAVGLTTVLAAPLAFAQDDQEIVVIGSRIAHSGDFEGPSPVLTVDREAIEKSGYTEPAAVAGEDPGQRQRRILDARQ